MYTPEQIIIKLIALSSREVQVTNSVINKSQTVQRER